MAVIVPTVLAATPQEYQQNLGRVSFAKRLHIDITDGEFAPNRTINLAQAYWPQGKQVDLHLMVKEPKRCLELCISMSPSLVIVHAEVGHQSEMLAELKRVGIKTGVAFLQQTDPSRQDLSGFDHGLVFTGSLGYYGGQLHRGSLSKIATIKQLKSDIEVGVDGGINDTNIADVVKAGADVLNVGGFLQQADSAKKAYDKLVKLVQEG
ncbi:hypothetical protein HY441_02355 [Candidatus Microgenomates bacterium]|nr:hypothetical protein [Candidatus Microgenomates bacterium]